MGPAAVVQRRVDQRRGPVERAGPLQHLLDPVAHLSVGEKSGWSAGCGHGARRTPGQGTEQLQQAWNSDPSAGLRATFGRFLQPWGRHSATGHIWAITAESGALAKNFGVRWEAALLRDAAKRGQGHYGVNASQSVDDHCSVNKLAVHDIKNTTSRAAPRGLVYRSSPAHDRPARTLQPLLD